MSAPLIKRLEQDFDLNLKLILVIIPESFGRRSNRYSRNKMV